MKIRELIIKFFEFSFSIFAFVVKAKENADIHKHKINRNEF